MTHTTNQVKSNRLTIVTTTYNRPLKLKELFESLYNQENHDFTWLIIDDGSSGDTNDIVMEFQSKAERKFAIEYYRVENGGKHRALNFAIPKINTEYSLIIDDDDILAPGAIDTIFSDVEELKVSYPNFGSIIYEHGIDEHTPMVSLPKKFDIGRRFWYLIENGINGDFNDVFVTKKLQEFSIPEFDGEKFMSEGILYLDFSRKYQSVFLKKMISIGKYNDGGLTKSIRKLQITNLKGSIFETRTFLSEPRLDAKYKIKKSLLLGWLLSHNHDKNNIRLFSNGIFSIFVFLGFIIGKVLTKVGGEK